MSAVSIRTATVDDLDLVIGFIRALADYERLADEVKLDRTLIGCHLFGDKPMAEVLIGEITDKVPAEVKAEAAKVAAIALATTLRENNYKLAQASVGLI